MVAQGKSPLTAKEKADFARSAPLVDRLEKLRECNREIEAALEHLASTLVANIKQDDIDPFRRKLTEQHQPTRDKELEILKKEQRTGKKVPQSEALTLVEKRELA